MQEQWSTIDDYLNDLLVPEDDVLRAAALDSEAAGLLPIAVAPNQGKLLYLMAKLSGAQRVLEIGTLGGYAAIWMARALPEDGQLVTLELDRSSAIVAQKNIDRAGLTKKIDIRVGAALALMDTMIETGEAPFDMIFIDADKDNNPGYFERALKLSKPGTLIILDNVVRQGSVMDEASDDPAVQGIRKCLEMVSLEPRVEACAVQTVGSKGLDGLCFMRVKDAEAK